MEKDWMNSTFEEGLVSVVIPCHDLEQYLPECLKSIVDLLHSVWRKFGGRYWIP